MRENILKYTAILSFLLLNYAPHAHAYYCFQEDNVIKQEMELFFPGQKKCYVEYTYFLPGYDEKHQATYFRNLKEFIITKTNKYCLSGSKNWDEDCQNTAMEYAYDDRWQKFKELAIKFIQNIQNKEYDKALALTHTEAVFFTKDNDDFLVKNQCSLSQKIFGYRAYINPSHQKETIRLYPEQERQFGDFDIEVFRKHLMLIDTNNLQFFLADITKSRTYDLVIPYQDQNITKYFIISFNFGRGRLGETVYSQELYDIAIYSTLPDSAY